MQSIDKKIIALIFIFTIIAYIPTLDLPYFEDAAFWTIPRALLISQHLFEFHRTDDLPKELQIPFEKRHPWFASMVVDAGHPPLFFWLLAFFYAVFGHSLAISHLLVVLFTAIALCFTYLLTMYFTKNDRTAALGACVLLFVCPLFFSQAMTLNHEMAVAAFSVMALYFFLKGKPLYYLLTASALCLTKESGLLVVGMIFVFVIIQKKGRLNVLEILTYGGPLLVYLAWLSWHRLDAGWWFFERHIQAFQWKSFLSQLSDRLQIIFISQYRWLLSICAMYGLLGLRKRVVSPSAVTYLLTLVVLFIVCFSFLSIGGRPRYLLPAFPFLFIFFVLFMRQVLSAKLFFVVGVLLFATFSVSQWHTPRVKHLEENLRFLDIIQTKQQALAYIAHNYSNATIWCQGYLYAEVTYPFLGYVSSPLKAFFFLGREFVAPKSMVQKNMREGDIVLVSYYPEWLQPQKIELYNNLDMMLVKQFRIRQDDVKVYQMRKSQEVVFSVK